MYSAATNGLCLEKIEVLKCIFVINYKVTIKLVNLGVGSKQ